MMNNITEKLNNLFQNEEFCVRYFDAVNDPNALKNVLAAEGIDLDETQLEDLIRQSREQMAKADQEGELSEEDLTDVSGGLIPYIVVGVALGIFFGYQVYKGRKGINDAVCRA